MFKPKHTIRSVADTLVAGLSEGSIVPRATNLLKIDVINFELGMKASLATYRRRELGFLVLGFIAITVSLVVVGSQLNFQEVNGRFRIASGNRATLALLSAILSSVLGFLLGFKTHEKSVELKTYIRVLKMADPQTAQRLALRVLPKLRSEWITS